MRHKVYGYKLGRSKDQRTRLFKGLVQSLFTYGSIETSQAKANAIKGLIDKVINLAKDKKRQRFIPTYLTDKNLQERLIKEIIPKLENRTSGYTSLVKLGTRLGDQTMMVRMSLIGVGEMKPIKVESRIKNQESREKQLKIEKVVSHKQIATRKNGINKTARQATPKKKTKASSRKK